MISTVLRTAFPKAAARLAAHRAARARTAYGAGQSDRAVRGFAAALKLTPGDVAVRTNLALALRASGRAEAALEQARQAVREAADNADAVAALAGLLVEAGRAEEALEALSPLVDTDHPGLCLNRAQALAALGREPAALAEVGRVLSRHPGHVAALTLKGRLCERAGETATAMAAYAEAVRVDPAHVPAWRRLANLRKFAADFTGAIAAYEALLEHAPGDAAALNNLATTRRAMGDLHGSLAVHERMIAADPAFPEGTSNWVFTHQYLPDISPEALRAAHARWQDLHGRIPRPPGSFSNDRTPEKPLRVGYVSGDLHRHPVGYFLAPVLARHNRAQVIPHVFSTRSIRDDLSARLRDQVPDWHEVAGLSPRALAKRIEAAGIDILVDLAGHTGHNALPVFARRAAPVQASWAGYVGSTGVAAMDWVIADRFHCPPEKPFPGPEQVMRLPDGYICFDPVPPVPEVGSLPASSTGRVTFGSFNVFEKLNDGVITCWAEILNAVGGSRLMLLCRALDDPAVRAAVVEKFAAAGVAADRLDLRGRRLHADVLAAYGEVDIALDPFPYSGGMTTLEALWMGVPVITRADGDRFAARHSQSHLSVAGCTDLIAPDGAGYRNLAIDLARDLPRLAELRAGLRGRLAASLLCDAARFTVGLERAYRRMWQLFCDCEE